MCYNLVKYYATALAEAIFSLLGVKMESFDYIKSNFQDLKSEVDAFARKVEREITLVAVTKSGSDKELLALAEAGITDIGENRPSELRRRGDLLRDSGYRLRLHEIGNLQRNKVKLIIESVDLIHSLDSLPLAEEIDRQAKKIGRTVDVLVEINSGREEQKGGIVLACLKMQRIFYLKQRNFQIFESWVL